MNVKQLQSFARIVELGSQNRAAAAMNISESALSRQISQLEAELGFKLFERDKIRLVPTDLGARFCREVERVLSGYDQLPRIAREMLEGDRDRFRLVVIQRLTDAIAIPAAAALQKKFSHLDLTIDIQPNRTLERRIRGLQYDIAVGPAGPALDTERSKPVVSAPLVAVIPKGHALASQATLRVSDLLPERMALTAHDSLMRRQISYLAAREGINLTTSIDVSETLLACQMAAQGHAVTICDPFSPSAYLSSVRVIPMSPMYPLEFVSLHADSPHALVGEFEALLQQHALAYLDRLGLRSIS